MFFEVVLCKINVYIIVEALVICRVYNLTPSDRVRLLWPSATAILVSDVSSNLVICYGPF